MIANMVVNPKGTKNISITENGTIVEDVKKYGKASITVNVQGGSTAHIYGAVWDGSSNPAWTRTDEAANFSDPNPYYSGMATTPSSPFDGLMPWSGMRRVTDSAAGELVEIPKFWYKWTRSGSSMQLQIADAAVAGFHVSPAHADRGDGVGERDYVYVGRYHCASDYKSKTGVSPIVNIGRATARSGIHNLGSNVWQWDYAMLWTIRMLYLVEFANWNSQEMIGYGCNGSEGGTDSMPYCTGTPSSSIQTYGSTQYRYIENLYGVQFEWIDGIYTNSSNVYAIKNPSDFSDTSNGTLVGTRTLISGFGSSWTDPTVSGYEYALYPSDASGSSSTYTCDAVENNLTSGKAVYIGASYYATQNAGLFYLSNLIDGNFSSSALTSRLMVLPSSRLS